eukprot:XP_002512465.2 uncharacterized protein LOC8287121 [Ricinus communis]
MSAARHGAEISDARTLSEISEVDTFRLSLDLVSAAKRNIGFLRAVSDSQGLHEKPAVLEAIRRYEELWMPLICDLMEGSTPPMVLPPLDIEWVWFCHTLNPVSYRQYCKARFSKLIGKPAIFYEENEEYALMRCQEYWIHRYPNESFENEVDSSSLQLDPVVKNEDLFNEVKKHRHVYSKFSLPYMSELVYLIAARQRYKGFLYALQRFADDGCSLLVPSLDVLLMLMTHQSYPTVYAEDMKVIETEVSEKVVGMWENVKVKEFTIQVCIFVRLNSRMKAVQDDIKQNFLRLRAVRCHRELKIDKPFSTFSFDSWKKVSHLYCEFGTKGVLLELRKHCRGFFKSSKLEGSATFLWNDLLRAHSLTLEREIDKQVRVVASITPPVQASYLLKCVPDRVTDDSGAMVSDVILRMNHYKPQEGRWLSRTVLDHAGRECFVIRMRVGGGIWRRGGETPSAVRWEDRIIEVREGSWKYVAGSIGRAPEKVVGTATPKEPPENWQASWCFSTGEKLLINWESSSTSSSDLRFCLINQASPDSTMKLLKGRRMQYQANKISRESKKENNEVDNEEDEDEDEDEVGFMTLVRFTEDNPIGRATALLNWKLLIVEILPEEDVVFALLLCISILRSVSEMRKEDVGSLLIRRRVKEAKLGARDWGAVILHPSSFSPSISSPYLKPWHWNAKAVITSDGVNNLTKHPATNSSQVEGGEKLYKRGIIT